jgi:hypothetical protein
MNHPLHHALVDQMNARKNRLLLVAEAALPESQFRAFRKLVLDEFGREWERELDVVLRHHLPDR